ncbi:MAG: large conductance mechanosensitive channel protein MscL [Oscillochloris sp.]|nr:large conductance mechanosensitive channel protein MscL [Oscillochloris sp.]
MFKGFRDFILRGNVLDLAVGVIIGAAFGAIVSSLTADILTPLIGALFGQPDFSQVQLGPLMIGNFINAIINFLLTAAALYFLVVAPVNALAARNAPEPPPPPATRLCPECLSSVPAQARRCAFCTSELALEA